eukprot:6178200-Pleurochrysis_carterae.AAC.2
MKSRRRTVRQHDNCMRAAGNSSKGNKERHPSIGHSHRVGGEVRTAQGGASLSKSRGGWYCKRQRREGVPGYRCRLNIPG